MNKFLLMLLVIPGGLLGQTTTGIAVVNESAGCSIANTGPNAQITATCFGLAPEWQHRIEQQIKDINRENKSRSVKFAEVQKFLEREVPRTVGELRPANDPMDYGGCEAGARRHPDSMVIRFGGDSEFMDPHMQAPEVILTVDDRPVITAQQKGNSLAFTVKVFSADHRIIAEVRDGKFRVNRNNFFYLGEATDSHTLQVIGQDDEEDLFLRFANPREIVVRGRFPLNRGGFAILSNTSTSYTGAKLKFEGNCGFANSGHAMEIN